MHLTLFPSCSYESWPSTSSQSRLLSVATSIISGSHSSRLHYETTCSRPFYSDSHYHQPMENLIYGRGILFISREFLKRRTSHLRILWRVLTTNRLAQYVARGSLSYLGIRFFDSCLYAPNGSNASCQWHVQEGMGGFSIRLHLASTIIVHASGVTKHSCPRAFTADKDEYQWP